MILDENFAILDEDEDIEDVESSEEVIDEGYIFDEEVEILDEALIKSASDVDSSKSSKSIEKIKKDFQKKISSGKWRAYKSSDAELLKKTMESKDLKRKVAGEIAGTAIGTAIGATAGSFAEKYGKKGVSALKNRKVNEDSIMFDEEIDIMDVLDEALDFYMESVIDYILDEEYDVLTEDSEDEILTEAKKKKTFNSSKNSNLAGKKQSASAKLQSFATSRINSSVEKKREKAREKDGMDRAKAINKANKTAMTQRKILNKTTAGMDKASSMASTASKATDSHIKNNKIGTGVGAGVGALSGAMLAKKLMSAMKFTVFTLNGLTILSVYPTNKEGEAKNKSKCYAILVKSDGSKMLLRDIGLKGKK